MFHVYTWRFFLKDPSPILLVLADNMAWYCLAAPIALCRKLYTSLCRTFKSVSVHICSSDDVFVYTCMSRWKSWEKMHGKIGSTSKQKMLGSQTFFTETPCYHKCFPFYIGHLLQAMEIEINGISFESNIFQFSFNVFAWLSLYILELEMFL